jgi:hypothetical protein
MGFRPHRGFTTASGTRTVSICAAAVTLRLSPICRCSQVPRQTAQPLQLQPYVSATGPDEQPYCVGVGSKYFWFGVHCAAVALSLAG